MYTFNKRDILIERLANNQLLSKSYQESRGKRFEKEIERKLNSHTLKNEIKNLSVEKLEIMNTTLNNDNLLQVLNAKSKEKYSSEKYFSGDISYNEAISLYNASKGFKELALLSGKIREYLIKSFPNLDYNKVVEDEGKVPELILAKEKLLKLTSNKELKEIIKTLNKEQLDKLNTIVSGDNGIVEFFNLNPEFISNILQKIAINYLLLDYHLGH